MPGWIPAALALHALAAAGALVLARRPGLCRWVAFGGSAAATTIAAAAAVVVLSGGPPVAGVLFHHVASGLVLDYALTPLSAWFLLVLGLLAGPIAVYSIEYLAHALPPSAAVVAGVAFNVLLASVEMVFVANHVIGFLFAWEVMTLATTVLVASDHESGSSRRAAYLYLVMSHLGTGAIAAGFFLLASASGSLSLAAILTGAPAAGLPRDVLFVLFFAGFGVKAGLIPVHVWLPEAHPAAPSSISALMSAVLITAGIYGLFRVCAFGLGTPSAIWGLAFLAVGALSAILGVLYALTENDLKRLLAYSTIEHSGIMVLGVGTAMTALAAGRRELAVIAVAASLYHVLNHAAFKGLLFLGAGSVVMASGTRQIEELGGLSRRMPWTAAFFLVGALAVSGLPLLNGFVSEWLTFQSLLLAFSTIPGLARVNFPMAGALLALTSALAAACFVKAFGIGFLALPRGPGAARAREVSGLMLLPQAGLALLCLALGLFPGSVLTGMAPVIASLPGLVAAPGMVPDALALTTPIPFGDLTPALLGLALLGGLGAVLLLVRGMRRWRVVRQVATWGCGGTLTPSTEYTSTAFSKPLLMMFRAVYRPTQQVEAMTSVSPYFPEEVRYRAAIEPTFERYVYGPIMRGVLDVAERMKVLQAGSLHAYLGYVLFLGLVLLLWLGGN